MSIFNYFFEADRSGIISDLIDEEKNRIIKAKLASKKDIDNVIGVYSELNKGHLIGLYDQLKSVVLPGDFNKIASMYKASEKDNTSEEPSKEVIEQAIQELKKVMDQSAQDGCSCEHKEEPTDNLPEEYLDPEAISLVLISKLNDIAYKLGADGNHSAALEVEKTINSLSSNIKTKLSNGVL